MNQYYQCPKCNRKSYNINDIENGYCGFCHTFEKDLCDTTMTKRFTNVKCSCLTYPDNLGPCSNHKKGSNGRCVYCDHELTCLPDIKETKDGIINEIEDHDPF